MSSPDRMEMHARAIANLVQAMDRMEAEQQVHDKRLEAHEEWMRRHKRVDARARRVGAEA